MQAFLFFSIYKTYTNSQEKSESFSLIHLLTETAITFLYQVVKKSNILIRFSCKATFASAFIVFSMAMQTLSRKSGQGLFHLNDVVMSTNYSLLFYLKKPKNYVSGPQANLHTNYRRRSAQRSRNGTWMRTIEMEF